MKLRSLLKGVALVVVVLVVGLAGATLFVLNKHFPIMFVSPNPTDFHDYYRVTVSLIHEQDEPVEIDVIIGCRTELRQILGESVSGRMVRVPYTYGVRTKDGQAVIMQTPNICGEDPAKVVPDDYLPMLFYAPDADNLEFMIAYVSEMAYEQKVSKLTFRKATITRASKEDYEAWKQTAPANVVPDKKVKSRFAHYFGGGVFPKDDPRNEMIVACRSVIKSPVPEELKAEIRALWPADRPRFWKPELDDRRFRKIRNRAKSAAKKLNYFGNDQGGEISTILEGKGIRRKNGLGDLTGGGGKRGFGEARRIPYSRSSGLPWHKPGTPLLSIDIRMNMADGADQGFAYCYRDLAHIEMHYQDNIIREWRFFVDGEQVAGVARAGVVFSPKWLIERDEFVFVISDFGLNPELARQR